MTINWKLKKIIPPVLVLGIAILVLVSIFSQLNYFKVNYVMVNQRLVTERERKAILMEEDRKALYFVNLKNIIKRVQYLYSTHSVEIRKIYPDTLMINILETNLVAYLLVKDQRGITGYGVNTNGQIISVHLNMSEKEIHHPVIQCLLKDISLRHERKDLIIGKYINSKSVMAVIRSLAMMK
ncbi:MAG: hypothetical protein OEZ36_13545, partial [Spirochaetota bacterium]|nr:hypothetical protein [Spirochaetota bacterium]